MSLICGDIFAGCGGWGIGVEAAGHTLAWSIEHDPTIAEVHRANLGGRVIVEAAQSVDIRRLEPIDLLTASPPCQSHSNARAKSLPARDDAEVGLCVLDYVRILRPRFVMIENVEGWKRSHSFKAIFHGLHELGYFCDVRVLNSADSSVPQTRRRLFLRASREGFLPPLPPPTPWRGWYSAIEDLIPTLPESRFADWQLKRLEAGVLKGMNIEAEFFIGGANKSQSFLDFAIENRASIPGIRNKSEPMSCVPAHSATAQGGRTFIVRASDQREDCRIERASQEPVFTLTEGNTAHGRVKAFIADCQLAGNINPANGQRGMTVRNADEPMFTVSASVNPTESMKRPLRAWLEQGYVVAMTPRALARFMGIPDSYVLPEKAGLACKVIGNAVCPLIAQRLLEGLS